MSWPFWQTNSGPVEAESDMAGDPTRVGRGLRTPDKGHAS